MILLPPPPPPSATLHLLSHYYATLLRTIARRRPPPTPFQGQSLHAHLFKMGHLPSVTSISTALFHMYATLGPPTSALLSYLHYLPSPSSIDFTALLSSHLRSSLPGHSLRLFFSSQSNPSAPRGDEVTMVVVFTAAARLVDLESGVLAHQLVVKRGLPLAVAGWNAAMDMYVKCGRMSDARGVFDGMVERSVVSWCVVLWGVLKWEGLESGRGVFERMGDKNEVAWCLMAAACVENGLPKEGMLVLGEMVESGGGGCLGLAILNYVSVCSLLSACSQVGDLTVARWVHAYALKARFVLIGAEVDEGDAYHQHQQLMVGSSLIDMYAKCGRIEMARRLFRNMSIRNVVTWNAMLSGLAMHGLGTEAVGLFLEMVVQGVQPDDISFVGLLSACSRAGLVDEGWKYFHELMPAYRIMPKMEHYACMVDILGRHGHLEEAEALIRKMPFQPNEVVLGSLMASCAIHGKPVLGRRLLEELVEMDPLNTEYHVLISNLYASSGKMLEADGVREGLKKKDIRKTPGVSYISINGCIHRFSAGDKTHPQTQEVYTMLEEMVRRLRLAGYVPDAITSQDSRVMDVYLGGADEREEREQALFYHSERLAVALGLVSTTPGAPLHIFKNLRICCDCHSVFKLLSSIFEREITIRDRNRFHCFKLGSCSCSDYW